ncbi:MAG: hypothetical protein QNK37_08535 [Acidobacteriota bacterium]|nr:hypothetical protein [Acidobacteriota bacterium]
MKYAHIIQALDENTLYSPATIARFAEANGLLPIVEHALQRVKVSMGRLRAYHSFPQGGDGMIRLSGQSPKPGWYGRRWKLLILENGEERNQQNDRPTYLH